MIQDNQKNFTRLQMLIDAIVIAVCYVLAWMIRFIGPFAYSAVRALAFEQYMFALVFICLLYTSDAADEGRGV